MSIPGKTTRPSPRGWPASRGKPLGMTFMIGHISLAGMAKGTIQSFVGEKKIPKPMLPIKLSIIVKKVPIFSLINKKKGIYQARLTNNTRLPISALLNGTVMPKTAPNRIRSIQKIRLSSSN